MSNSPSPLSVGPAGGAGGGGGGGGELVDWSARALSEAARAMMRPGAGDGGLGARVQHLRPYICPFDRVMGHVERGSRVLDVGCGRGLMLGLLDQAGLLDATPGRESVGFDCAPAAIATANAVRERLRGSGAGHVRFECRDAAAAWPEGVFDVVTIVDVLHHVPVEHRRGMFASAASRLRPGGCLIYKDMAARGWRSGMNTLHDLVMAREWVRYTPVEVVEGWAREAGLTLRRAEDVNMLWYGHQLRVFTT